MRELECARCGGTFGLRDDHTEIVRRDFRERPRPAIVEHLCPGCWRTYVEEFLGEAFDDEAFGDEGFDDEKFGEQAIDDQTFAEQEIGEQEFEERGIDEQQPQSE